MESTEVQMENDVPDEEEGVPLIFKPLTCSMCFQSGNHRDTREIGIEVNNNRYDVGIKMNNRNDVGIQGHNSNSTKQQHLLHIIQQSPLPTHDKTERSMSMEMHTILDDSHQPHWTATGSTESCVADVVKNRLKDLKPEKDIRQEEYSIFRVPSNLQAVGGIAYIPQMVSIGPYHYGSPQLEHMQMDKVRVLQQFLDHTKANVDCCIETMAKLEHRARSCYSGLADGKQLTSCEFVEMMLLDGCFILELFMERPHSPVPRAIIPCIQRDLLMLENQIPLFVLKHLLKFYGGQKSVTKLALDFFKPPILGRSLEEVDVAKMENDNSLHLLHIILRSLFPSQLTNSPSADEESKSRVMTHSVSMLRDFGVRFEKNNNSKYITDIVFDKGCLKIPQLVIDDSTRTIVLNLMAFEQCCYWQCSNAVTSFVSFMDDLINEPRDVMHLHRKDIILHSLGSEKAVAEMLNHVCREIAIRDDYIGSLSCELKKVNEFIQKKRHWWWASLRREHLRHPWAIASVSAGALFLGLTITATTYAILSYHVHKS